MKVTKLKDNVVLATYENVTGLKQAICPTHIHLRFKDTSLMLCVEGFDILVEEEDTNE